MLKLIPARVRGFRLNVLACSCLMLLCIVPATGQSLTGQQIFDRMLQGYRTVTTYQDEGRVTTDFYDPGQAQPSFTTVRSFQTAYQRPTRQFRFHYREEKKSHPVEMVIWTEEDKTYQWWTIDKSTSRQWSLPLALAGATGVSGTASRKVPGLLLDEPIGAGWGVDMMTNVKLVGRAVQNKRPCYLISGDYAEDKVATLWIDQQSFLILRIDEDAKIPGKNVKQRITYSPVINKPVPVVRFKPPDAH